METLIASITSPTGVEVLAFVGSLFFLAAGANQVLKLLDRNKEQPPPSATYATKTECATNYETHQHHLIRIEADLHNTRDGLKNDHQRTRDEIRFEIGEVTRLAEVRNGGLHERINQLLAAVSDLGGQVRRMDK